MTTTSSPGSGGFLRRLFKNLGWLLGGKAAGAILSLVYLGFATRSLGPQAFGTFALIFTYGQVVGNFAQFQSWQLMIRFGAGHLEQNRPDRLGRLVVFGALMDMGSAIVSASVGFLMARTVGHFLGWSNADSDSAAWFSLSLLFGMRATPTGLLRLFDKFDALTFAETMTPIIRFLGAAIAFLFLPTIGAFLIVWAVSELAASITLWCLAIRALHDRNIHPALSWPHGATVENPDIWRFAWLSNATSAVNAVWQQCGTLAVGRETGAAAAGGFRIAFQIAQGMAKPALLLGRVVYPEFARQGASTNLAATLWRSSLSAGVAGAAMIALTALLGQWAITAIAGARYAGAAPTLLLLSIAAAIDLCGFALEPALLALGRAGYALIARALGALVYLACLLPGLHYWGASGAGYAAIAGSATAFSLSLLLVRHSMTSASSTDTRSVECGLAP